MKLTLKEQLVYLAMKQVSYKARWHYIQLFQASDIVSLETCCARVALLIERGVLSGDERHIFHDMDDATLQLCRQFARQALMIGEVDYPRLWLEIPKPPLIIYYKGHLEVLRQPLVSIVGTRRISEYGKQMTQELTRAILAKGWGCVSGLATGVDQIVHETAVDARQRSTVAIVPTGLERYYPETNRLLQQELGQRHLVLSEYLPMENARKHHFIMRNRLVAGLTPVTLVMEAAMKSGSLITANFALQYDREVHALPGRIDVLTSQGCNELISQGAAPIVSIPQTIETLERHFFAQQFI